MTKYYVNIFLKGVEKSVWNEECPTQEAANERLKALEALLAGNSLTISNAEGFAKCIPVENIFLIMVHPVVVEEAPPILSTI